MLCTSESQLDGPALHSETRSVSRPKMGCASEARSRQWEGLPGARCCCGIGVVHHRSIKFSPGGGGRVKMKVRALRED